MLHTYKVNSGLHDQAQDKRKCDALSHDLNRLKNWENLINNVEEATSLAVVEPCPLNMERKKDLE